ncbi:hypothetical protein ACTXT7_015520 [Hymenolepis weldensis]
MTEESVTPVHICAALGDYVGLRKLLNAGFPHLTQDRLGRLPLHYAVQTNLPTVIMLLSKGTDQLQMLDFDDKVPLMFCQYQPYQTIGEYIMKLVEAQNLLRLTGTRENVEKNAKHSVIVHDAHWKLPLHFEAYLCTKIRPMYWNQEKKYVFMNLERKMDGNESLYRLKTPFGLYDGFTGVVSTMVTFEANVFFNGREYCQCSEDCVLHEKFSDNDDLNEVIASRSEDYVKRPTNTFGQFETPSSNVMAEFVRITDDTSTDNLSLLFFKIWKLQKPELVLTMYGSVPSSKSLQKRFYYMIINVVQKTLTWLITDGVFGSIAEVISNGMRGYAEAYGLSKLQVIGLAPWRLLPFHSQLHSSDYSGCYRVKFPDKEKVSTNQSKIAPFHTRYLFVDSGGKEDLNCIQNFRNRFEVWLANTSMEVESFELSLYVPVCGILVAGNPEHALGIYQALSRSIPFVVIGDSGGLASILEQCINERQYLPDHSALYTGATLEEAEMAENEIRERIIEIMLQFWTEEEITPETLDSVIRILSYSDLIEFFSYEKDSDGTLDAKIVSSLINPC